MKPVFRTVWLPTGRQSGCCQGLGRFGDCQEILAMSQTDRETEPWTNLVREKNVFPLTLFISALQLLDVGNI